MAWAAGAIAYFGPFLFGIWCIVCLFRNSRQGMLYQARRSYGWIALCTAPIVVAQVLVGYGPGFSFSDIG